MTSSLHPSVYLGLLLIAFAALSQKAPSVTINKIISHQTAEPTVNVIKKQSAPSDALQNLYHKIKEDPLLQKNVDGLTVEYQDNSIVIRMIGDDIFESGVYSMREAWLPTIDRFALLLLPEQKKGLIIKIHTFTDAEQAREVRSGDFGASDFTLSSLRAEWIARYLQRQHGFEVEQKMVLISHGSNPKGKRVDLELQYP